MAHHGQTRRSRARQRRSSDRPFDRACILLGFFALAVGTLFAGVMLLRLPEAKFPVLHGLGSGLMVVGALATLSMILGLIQEFIGLLLIYSLGAIALGVITGVERAWKAVASKAMGRSVRHGESTPKRDE